MNHSNRIIDFCDEVLNEKTCHALARKYKFIERSTSKLKGHEFIKAMIIPSEGLSTDSLQGICKRIKNFNSEAELSTQALCERINDISSKELMKSVFAAILHFIHKKIINKCPKLEKTLGHFNSILIEDSTVMKLNEKLQAVFEGTNRGGTGAKSQAKIDLIYNLMTGTIVNADIYNGKDPDQGLASRILKYVQAGDLVIRDLGYFVLKSLNEVADAGAYFISRLQPNVKVFLQQDDLQPLDIGEYTKKFSEFNIIEIDKVFLGDEKVPSRIIMYRLPKEIVDQRSREANKRSKDTGRKISRNKKLCMQFAIYVTNVLKEVISAEIIGTVYRLRWEIELIFKRWKSQLKIDYLKGIDKNRIECLIWSRLCTIVIVEIVNDYVSQLGQNVFNGREISHKKLIDYILRSSEFCEAIAKNHLERYLKEMKKDARRMLFKDNRKRTTMREKVFNRESYYSKQPPEYQKVA